MNVTEMNLQQSEKVMVRTSKTIKRMALPFMGLLLLTSIGCQKLVTDEKRPQKEIFPAIAPVVMQSPVGVPPVPAKLPTEFDNEVYATNILAARPDPFALFPYETAYETKATNVRTTLASGPMFGQLFIPHVPVIRIEAPEPQPFRRLAGVLIGDSVMAIIDMGDNGPMQVVRPGMQIPNSPWKVVSINENQATLHRDGDKKPNTIIVTLQGPQEGGGFAPAGPSFGSGQAPGGNGGGGGGRRGGGGRFGGGGGGGAS